MNTSSPPRHLLDHRNRFRERFGASGGERLFFAPGRVNLLGAHLDYNGGPVLPTAIDRGTFFAVRPRGDGVLRLASTIEPETFEGKVGRLPRRATGAWFDYPLGVVRFLEDRSPLDDGADVLVGGDLPIGAGLSSSASICVGTAHSLSSVWALELDVAALIDAALWGERDFVGVKCGIMDPYAVAMTRPGHLLWLDCKDASVEHLPIDTEQVTIAVADTGVRRELAQVAFNERVAECARAFELLQERVPGATCLRDVPLPVVEESAELLTPPLLSRARHVAAEVERTFAARRALMAGELEAFGRGISASHESLRDQYEVSIPELDVLVEASRQWPGVLGARLTGAGFGGCVVIVLLTEAREGLQEHLAHAFEGRFQRRPEVAFFRGDSGPREVGA